LVMFFALILIALEPFRRTAWRFHQDRISCEVRWPIFRRLREWQVVKLDRLELRHHAATDTQRLRLTSGIKSVVGETAFAVAVDAQENVALCTIDAITEGETRWFAHFVLDQRPHWFGK